MLYVYKLYILQNLKEKNVSLTYSYMFSCADIPFLPVILLKLIIEHELVHAILIINMIETELEKVYCENVVQVHTLK